MTDTIPASRMAIARGTLYRRILMETSILGEMITRGSHKNISYQSGMVDGLNIAAALTQVLDKNGSETSDQTS